jgi:ribonuclease T1
VPSSASSRARPSASPLAVVALVVLALVLLVVAFTRTGGVQDLGTRPPGAQSPSSGSNSALPSGRETPDSGLVTVAESALPAEAAATLVLIRAGGPFPYEEDGGRFGNRERELPRRSSAYYREYTVETPGEGDRGPRRIVAGADGDLYWTTDHYASFRQIEEGR